MTLKSEGSPFKLIGFFFAFQKQSMGTIKPPPCWVTNISQNPQPWHAQSQRVPQDDFLYEVPKAQTPEGSWLPSWSLNVWLLCLILQLVKKPKPLISRHPKCLLTLLSLFPFTTFQHLFLSVSEGLPLTASVTSSFFVQACVPLPDDLVNQQEQKYTVTLCSVDQMRFLF